ncbi:amid-like mitochondrial oxidoreductase [Irpex lacteus]|nr:amid-like mitochondrial oxidoreductase [Irpex lacteus]
MSSKRNIVVLGGSFAGVSAAHTILKHVIPSLPDPSSYRVVLISSSTHTFLRPAAPRAMLDDKFFDQSKLFIPLADCFAKYPSETVELVHGRATQLDTTARTVAYTLSSSSTSISNSDEETKTVEYYALVIATGSSTPSPLHGFNAGTHTDLQAHWASFRTALKSAKSIVIAGGGTTGVETAGELGEYLNGRPGWLCKVEPKVNITLVASTPQVLPYLRPKIAGKAERLLREVGVNVIKNTRVADVSPPGAGTSGNVAGKATLTLDNNGTVQTIEADLYIPSTGCTPNSSFVPAALKDERGYVLTSNTLRVEGAGERMYALGDVATYARPSIYFLETVIPVFTSNITRDLLLTVGKSDTDKGVPKEKVFVEDKKETQLVPIGTSKGVGAFGGWQLPSGVVWAIKGRDYWMGMMGGLWSGEKWAKVAP